MNPAVVEALHVQSLRDAVTAILPGPPAAAIKLPAGAKLNVHG
jgi:hypothetical protein